MPSDPELLFDGPTDALRTIALAHGAGAGMDTPFMSYFAKGLADQGFGVVRFEFPYMAVRRKTGKKKPPDREPVLLESFRQAVRGEGTGRVFLGGKSMGGRMASMVADELAVAGLVCFGYPFHPPGKTARLRTAHLGGLRTPALILQGERDIFGSREEVAGYMLSPSIRVEWIPDGDHSLKPRAKSGATAASNLEMACAAAAEFILAT